MDPETRVPVVDAGDVLQFSRAATDVRGEFACTRPALGATRWIAFGGLT